MIKKIKSIYFFILRNNGLKGSFRKVFLVIKNEGVRVFFYKIQQVVFYKKNAHLIASFKTTKNKNELKWKGKVNKTNGLDVLVFPIIDWDFRFQRPQQLTVEFANRGHRVFYLTTRIAFSKKPEFQIINSPKKNVFIIQLGIPNDAFDIYQHSLSESQITNLQIVLQDISKAFHIEESISIINLPFWTKAAETLTASHLVYDCMDYHQGFENSSTELLSQEKYLFEYADLVISTSEGISDQLNKQGVKNDIIRNAAEIDFFSVKPAKLKLNKSNPIVGYYGAIAEWFDFSLVLQLAKKFPHWDFILIGRVTNQTILKNKQISNIKFIGEVDYQDLPSYLHAFDVAIIPFILNDLILCTNPVKIYEYLAAGKPVVTTAMPELELLKEICHVAYSHTEFENKLLKAMNESHNKDLSLYRKNWAKQHTWRDRIEVYDKQIKKLTPLVSVIVLTYNNLDLTKQCLFSLENRSCYSNLELVLVDNASSDGTVEFLTEYSKNQANIKLILNKKNAGFAAGNNIGLRHATGEYLILLNNDTCVTKGWIHSLLSHFKKDQDLGVLGPVTNNIGNEAKINISYESDIEMEDKAFAYTRKHLRERIYVKNVAFFCVAFKRLVFDQVGFLDEDFGLGFFEDDDYCNRVREKGYKIAIAEDSFVHHHLSASFDQMKVKKRLQLFENNKKIYEKKWGAWVPHKYRNNL